MLRKKIKYVTTLINNYYFDENNNLVIQYQMIIAIIGSIVLMVGVFLPFIKAPFLGVVDYTRIGKYYDEIVIACGLVAIILALLKLYRWLVIPAFGSLCVIVFSIYKVFSKVSMLREMVEDKLYNNPYKDLIATFIDSMQEATSLQWGVIILGTGVLLLLLAGMLQTKNIVIPVKVNSSQSNM